MVDYESRGAIDDAPPSSIRRRDQRALDTICGILRTRFELPTQEARLDSRFVEDLGMDIFDLPDLILSLEEAFEMDIPVAVAARMLTLGDAVKCVLLK
jgi:acyl carrier protein